MINDLPPTPDNKSLVTPMDVFIGLCLVLNLNSMINHNNNDYMINDSERKLC